MNKLETAGDVFGILAPYLPPTFGALIGLRWAKDQTPFQRFTAVLFGIGVSVYFAPAIGEVLGYLPDKSPRIFAVISVLTALLGMDVLTGFVAIAKAFAINPLQSVKEWWAMWRGR